MARLQHSQLGCDPEQLADEIFEVGREIDQQVGFVETLDGPKVSNQGDPLISGLIAGGPLLKDELFEFLAPYTQAVARK